MSTEPNRADSRQVKLLAVFQRDRGTEWSIDALERELGHEIPRRTLQRLLAEQVEHQVLRRQGATRAVRYSLRSTEGVETGSLRLVPHVPGSVEGSEIRDAVRRPLGARRRVGHRAGFLDDYLPNQTAYLSQPERDTLRAMGTPPQDSIPAAGTFAGDLLDRLLIDLSYASSHLEGNTYTLLDTRYLIERGQAAAGKDAIETKMILNHKEAIEFLVRDPACRNVNEGAIKSLHAFLSDGLLANPADVGRLRTRAVGIAGSVYTPLALGLHIDEQFGLLVSKAHAILDPFEQALFLMVHLPYLQPFMDVNKRVSRLAANIPLVQSNLCPLSFIDVPTRAYVDAMLGVYELNRTALLRDVFLYAYERSCQQYAAVKQSLQPPDTFRNRFRRELSEAIATIVRDGDPADAASVARHIQANVPLPDRDRFIALVVAEFQSLNPDSAVRFGLRPLEFQAWQKMQAPR